MPEHDDTDVNVAEVRALARRLNAALDVLQQNGVQCCSVIGPPPNWQMGGMFREHDLTRVSLVLDFKPDQPVGRTLPDRDPDRGGE